MHNIYKIIWAVRAIIYKVFAFGSLELPSYIGPPIFLLGSKKIFIGRRVRIFPGLRAECHNNGRLLIKDDISIGQNFHVICSSDLHINTGCLISGNVFITDTDHVYSDPTKPIFEQENTIRETRIGSNCFIGTGARIQAGTILGNGCIVGANSVVRGVFPDHSVIVGIPGRVIKKYNSDKKLWERISR